MDGSGDLVDVMHQTSGKNVSERARNRTAKTTCGKNYDKYGKWIRFAVVNSVVAPFGWCKREVIEYQELK